MKLNKHIKSLIIIFISCFLILNVTAVASNYDNDKDFDVSAKSAILIDKSTGRILYGKNIYEKRAIASTTKIMTALLTLEQENKDEIFTVDTNAIKVQGTSMGLKEGDKTCLYDLAVGMLLASGNDSANAAAVKIAGNQKEFANLMNKRAKEIGMKNTLFTTPSGLDDGEPYSCALDLAKLASSALDNKDFSNICSKKSMPVAFGNPPTIHFMKNHNKLLKLYDKCTGIKTGFTKKAGRCLVSSAEKDGNTLICVTLGASDDWNIHINLYEKYFEEIAFVSLPSFLPNLSHTIITEDKEKSYKLKPAYDFVYPLRKDEKENIEIEIMKNPFDFTNKNSDIFNKAYGLAFVFSKNQKIAEIPLILDKNCWQERWICLNLIM